MGDCSVFVIHHGAENYPALRNNITTPILGGSQNDEGDFGSRISLREITGDTICEKHHLLSEFTVYYWIWKNIIPIQRPKYVGIFHYRTFLNLKSNGTLNDDFLTRKGITAANIKALLGRTPGQKDVCDAIITDVDKESWYSVDWKKAKLTIRKQYEKCHPLGSILFPTAIDFLKNGVSDIRVFKLFLPGIGDYAKDYFNDPKAKPYFKSVFVSTINYFSVYMEYLFTVLNHLMNNKSVKDALAKLEKEQKEKTYRLLAFFGERLTALFISYFIDFKKNGGEFKIKQVERYHEANLEKFLSDAYPYTEIKELEVIPLVRFFSDTNKLYAYRPVNENGVMEYLPSTSDLKTEKFWVDRLVGYLLKMPQKGTKPVYMLQEPIGKDFFYTTDASEYERAKTVSGYTIDFGCIGYIFAEAPTSLITLPMVRYLYNAKDRTRHFYTPYTEEAAQFGDLLGIEGVEEGVLGYFLCADQNKPILWDDQHDTEQ